MGKSIRSKGMRINRATRRVLIHGPKEEDRLARLVAVGEVSLLKNSECPMVPIEEEETMEEEGIDKVLTRDEKEKLFLTRNQYKKRIRAKSLSKKRKTGRGHK